MKGGTKVIGRHGFTLVEVIVTVGILLVLGVVALPVASKVSMVGSDVTCLSNLRQIGLGIMSYSHESNGLLPGPLQGGQYPWWPGSVNDGDRTQLASYVAPYLDLKRTRTKWNGNDVFVCPAFKKVVKKLGDAPVYRLNARVPMGSDLIITSPFGFPNSSYPQFFGTNKDFLPLRMNALVEIRDAAGNPAQSSTWLLKDADQEDVEFTATEPGLSSRLPAKRVHGRHRNALFFDFRVGPIDSETPSL